MKILIIFALFCPLVSHSQSLVIGNSGDGYIMNLSGEVLLRDLVEYNVNKEVELPPQKDSQVKKALQRLEPINTKLISIDKDRLALRVLALESIHPAMDDIFFEVLKSYHWIAVDKSLLPINKEDGFFFIDGKPIQIANRHGNTVRIYKAAWNKMPDLHKSALIFHEVLFSMMKVQEDSIYQGYYSQSVLRVRELVGRIFSSNFQFSEVEKQILLRLFKDDLEIPFQWLSKVKGIETLFETSFVEYNTFYGSEIRVQILPLPSPDTCYFGFDCGVWSHSKDLKFSFK